MSIRFRAFSRHAGLLLLVLSALILAVGAFAGLHWLVWKDEGAMEGAAFYALLTAAFVGTVLGGTLFFVGRRATGHFGYREALLLVAAGWLLGAALCGTPYRLWSLWRPDAAEVPHDFDSCVNCYFEAMSGLTTTGATIVQSIATLPRSLLLLRALTHWLGGLGIVVLFVAVLPLLGVGGRRVFRIEAPGPSPEGVTPKIQDTARVLWLIYLGLTVAEIIALKLCGMSLFDSVCHTMATLATGGFSTLDDSVAGFDSTAVHGVIICFMFLAGVNFGLYFALLRGRWRHVLKNTELRLYVAVMVAGTAIITAGLLWSPPVSLTGKTASAWITFRDALFQVVSIQTTTGFCTADFDTWNASAKITLVVLMFIGGCAGSTGGGVKVIRILIAGKLLLAEVEHAFRPNVVRSVKIGATALEPDQKIGCLVYILGILLLFAAGTSAVFLLEASNGIDPTTALSAAAATLNNIGPGLARVGATQNYAWFAPETKIVLSGLMVLGRLEVFAIIVLFSPRFWRGE
jgi:trk system potassium uptake protein TrkH